MRLKTLGLLLLLVPFPAHAEHPPVAARAVSGDTLALDDGRLVRLEGLAAPSAATPERAEEAQKTLQAMVAGKTLHLADSFTDRYGRLAGQVFVVNNAEKPLWVEGAMLEAGLAFLYPPDGDVTRLAAMRAAETAARKARRGIWGEAAYADLPATAAPTSYGRFAFVTGTVLKAARVKNKVYLNFGANWKTDFTVAIAAHDLRAFRKADIDPLQYQGKTVRVRGWVTRNFGPMITATSPWQIEILSAPH